MKKTLMIMLALVLVIAMSVTGTMAYLTAKTEVVTNTFTVGNVAITLDETDVDVYGVKDGETRVTENTYKLIPGHKYVKDPTIHFAAGSEASYLFVKVVNPIAGIEADTKIAAQITANGWTVFDAANGVYYKTVDANKTEAAVDYKVFGEFTVAENADLAASYGAITIVAYAVQQDGMANVNAAWDAVKGL